MENGHMAKRKKGRKHRISVKAQMGSGQHLEGRTEDKTKRRDTIVMKEGTPNRTSGQFCNYTEEF